MKLSLFGLLLLSGLEICRAQQAAPSPTQSETPRDGNARILESLPDQGTPVSQRRQEYRIGAEDLIEITVFEAPELSRSVRVSSGGEISLPLIGTVKASGLSPMELESVLKELLRRSYVRDPQVSVFLKEYRSDPVSIVGAVKVPGLYQIQTRRSLVEILAMAQGFSEGPQWLPGRTIIIARQPNRERTIETAPGSAPESPEVIEIPIKELLQSGDPKWNVPVYPGDVIKVVPAGTFYVAGDVNQPGGFPLTDFDNVSAMQALAMAGGTKRTANLKDAVIIRRDGAGNRVEERIDLKRVYQGQGADIKLAANEILFVPGSVGKEAALRAMEGAIQASMYLATGLLVWGR
jgi:polysaccharide export outer membrane protein